MKDPILSCHGEVSTDFKVIAQLKKYLLKIRDREFASHRLDCYPIHCLSSHAKGVLFERLNEINLGSKFENIEAFVPSEKYPPHCDEGGVSLFVPLESGLFQIGGVSYPIVPFVIYSFEDSEVHNSDFGAIMIK